MTAKRIQAASNTRRALIIRRQAVYRAAQTRRETWNKKREALADDTDEIVGEEGVVAELSEDLIG